MLFTLVFFLSNLKSVTINKYKNGFGPSLHQLKKQLSQKNKGVTQKTYRDFNFVIGN